MAHPRKASIGRRAPAGLRALTSPPRKMRQLRSHFDESLDRGSLESQPERSKHQKTLGTEQDSWVSRYKDYETWFGRSPQCINLCQEPCGLYYMLLGCFTCHYSTRASEGEDLVSSWRRLARRQRLQRGKFKVIGELLGISSVSVVWLNTCKDQTIDMKPFEIAWPSGTAFKRCSFLLEYIC